MQHIEELVLRAWNELKSNILDNPRELKRRLARRNGRTYSRPPRAWCVAIRASDHRIGITNGRIDPEYAVDPRDPDHPGRVVEHTVTLTAELIRAISCPVQLNAGGEMVEP